MELQNFAPQQFYSQFAFKPAASIVDRRGETAEAMLEFLKLPSLSLHPTAVEVTSEDNREQFRIGLVQIYASLTGFDDFDETAERVQDFLGMAIDHLGPSDVESINIRSCDIAPAESFEALRDRLDEQLVSGFGGLKSAVGAPISDSGWVFEFDDSDVAGRVQFGPMRSDQMEEILQVNGGLELPPAMLFLLVDAKFPGTRQEDAIGGWKKTVAKQRGIAERTGAWLKEMVA